MWTIGGILAVFVGWFLIKIAVAYSLPPEISGKALLKSELKREGIDVNRIPDEALNEIVNYCIEGAMTISSLSSRPEDRNWRSNLVDNIRGQTQLIKHLMDDMQKFDSRDPIHGAIKNNQIRHILLKHKVINEI